MLERFRGRGTQDEDGDAPEQDAQEGRPLRATLPRLLTVADVAEQTGLKEWRVYELASSDQIPHKRIGRRIMFVPAAVARWLEEDDGADNG